MSPQQRGRARGLSMETTGGERDPTSIEGRIQETERRFQNMADAAPVMLWMSREDSLCTFFNQTWFDFTGRTQEEEWGLGWAENVHFEDLQRCLDTYVDAFNQRQVFEVEYRLRRADGEYRWILDRGTPRYTPDGAFAGFIGSCIDITDRKHAEIELRSALQAKQDFMGIVSHELRTPLATLRLQLERFKREGTTALTEAQRDILDRMSISNDRLADLIDGVLQYSRIERGRTTAGVTQFDLAALVRASVDASRPAAERKGLALCCVVAQGLPQLTSDPALVRLIVMNLLSNAIKFTGTGFVEVVLEIRGAAHRISVKDSGPGIPPEDQARIFEPFQRLEPTRHKHVHGIGIGLALVKAVVATIGGQIEVQSERDRGSVFTVSIPSNLGGERQERVSTG